MIALFTIAKLGNNPSVHWWIDEYIHVYKGLLFSLKKNQILMNAVMDGSWRHYAKWNKLVTKEKNIEWTHLNKVSKVVKFIETEIRMVVSSGVGRLE